MKNQQRRCDREKSYFSIPHLWLKLFGFPSLQPSEMEWVRMTMVEY